MRGRKNGQLDATTGERKCAACLQVKSLTEFSVNTIRAGRLYYRSYCKSCSNKQRHIWYHKGGGARYYKQYQLEHPEQLAKTSRRHRLKKGFGLTEEDFNLMLKTQKNKCKVCSRLAKTFKKRFSIDHNHKTGKTRALLCGKCNTGLGLFQDSPELLRKAANYLESFEGE